MRKLGFFVAPFLLLAGFPLAAKGLVPPVEQGLWLGDIPLCSDTVTGLSMEPSYVGDGEALNIELTEQAAVRLTQVTTEHTNEQLPLVLNGEILAQPFINEPIFGGRLSLPGLDPAKIAGIRAAVVARCPAMSGDYPTRS